MSGGVSWSLYAKEQRYALGAGFLFILPAPLGEEGSGPPSAAREWSFAGESTGV